MPQPVSISRRAQAVDASGIRKVFDLAAKLKDPINLSIGLPDFDAPEPAKQAAIDAIHAGHNRYTVTQGIEPLRKRLRDDYAREIGRDPGNVLVTSGVAGAVHLALTAILEPGDEVVFLDPYFVMYKHLTVLADGRPVAVDSYPDFRFNAARVEKAITKRTRALVICSPGNPTGAVMSQKDVRDAVDLARRHDLLLISDEIYEVFVYDKADREGMAHRAGALYEKTLTLRGFSKSHGMTGWRLAWTAGPPELIEQMTKLQQFIYVCAPAPLQHGALAALDCPTDANREAYERKRDIAFETLSRKFKLGKPGGAFYAFPAAPTGITGSEFCIKAIENNVLTMPGCVFSERDTHFRVSYAVTDKRLRRGCEILCSLA